MEGYKANITNANNTHTTKQAELDNELTTASSKLDLDELEANAQAEAIHAAGVTEIAQKTKDATTDLLKVIKEMRDAHNTAADAAKASATPDTDMIAFHKNATTAIMNEAAAKAETIKATKTAATAELEAAHEARLQDIAKHFANEVESLNANIANAKAAYNDGFAKHLIDAQQPATEALVKLNEAEKAADSTETKWLLEGKTTFDTIMPALDDAIAELDGAAVAADTDTEASEDEDETDTADENEDEAAPAPAPAEAAPAPAVVVAEGEDEAAPAPAEGDNAADIDVTGASAKYACEFDQYQ